MSPEDALVHADGQEAVKIGGYLLPVEDFSLTRFMLDDLGMQWLHPGGILSSERLLEQLAITPDMRVLDLGCGVGSTCRYLVSKYNCTVVGLDLDPEMILQARARSLGRRYASIEYCEADANDTSLENDSFDRVIVQSVACFNDKPTLLREITRLLKQDGRVGLNEVTWVKPPTEKVERVTRATICETFKGALLEDDWVKLLEDAGLDRITHEAHAFKPVAPYQMLREEGLLGTVKVMARVLRHPEINMRLSAVSDYFRQYPGYFGYGLYMAHKPGTH
jgi:ubiquinone/menaquinone biosynthesis C-methylase UbiE